LKPHVTNSPNGTVFTYTAHTTGTTTKFYAEDGFIRVVDEQTGEYTPRSIIDFTRQTQAMKAVLRRHLKGVAQGRWQDNAERRDWARLIDAMEAVLAQAKAQGDPTDPQQLRELVHDQRSIRAAGFYTDRLQKPGALAL
jgi:hypothetical protein